MRYRSGVTGTSTYQVPGTGTVVGTLIVIMGNTLHGLHTVRDYERASYHTTSIDCIVPTNEYRHSTSSINIYQILSAHQ